MKKKKIFPRKMSVVFSFFLTYIITLMVPILIGGFIYSISFKTIENEINRSNTAILKQVQQSLDSRLSDVEQLALRIGLDSRVTILMNVKTNLNVTHRYTMYQIVSEFRSYIIANDFINSFYVYLKNSDIALTSEGSYSSRDLVSNWYKDADLSYKDWSDLIDNTYKKQYLRINDITGDESNPVNGNDLVYMQPLPIRPQSEFLAAVVVSIDESTLLAA